MRPLVRLQVRVSFTTDATQNRRRHNYYEDGSVDDSGEIIHLSAASHPRVFQKTDVLFVPKSAASQRSTFTLLPKLFRKVDF
ncbi:unnamed protein product [Macrosiphum euphorbiae]|uniref:Uncharacterized protein n=1 Tax=Macrosiphum euphorbiae TaxID=13131 RepID=A0AAV0XKT1_9HEMI|nr:unnamed protein product [Macrosiphum euphorbiae]